MLALYQKNNNQKCQVRIQFWSFTPPKSMVVNKSVRWFTCSTGSSWNRLFTIIIYKSETPVRIEGKYLVIQCDFQWGWVISAPMSRRLIVVVHFLPLLVVSRNGEATLPRGRKIRSLPTVQYDIAINFTSGHHHIFLLTSYLK